MSKNSSLAVTLVLLSLALLPTPAMAASLAEAFPPDVLIYVEVPSVAVLSSGASDTAAAAIMAEPEVKAFLEKGFPALTAFKETFLLPNDDVARLRRMITGQVSAAIFTDPSGAICVAVAADLAEKAAEFQTAYDAQVKAKGLLVDTVEIPGATVRVVDTAGRRLVYTFAGNAFIFASSVEGIKTLAQGLLSGRTANLANDPSYRKCLFLASARQPELLAYADTSRIFPYLQALMPPEVYNALDALGLTSVSHVLYSSHVSGMGFIDKFLLHFPEGKKGVFAALAPAPDRDKYLAMIPSNVTSAGWGFIDFPSFTASVSAAWKAAFPSDSPDTANTHLEAIKAASGLDVAAELVESVGNNSFSYSLKPSQVLGIGFSGGLGRFVQFVELTDEPRFTAAFNVLWQYLKNHQNEFAFNLNAPPLLNSPITFSFVDSPFAENTVREIRIALNPMLMVAPSFAVSDRFLIFGLDAQSVKNALSSPDRFPQTLLANPDFQKASSLAGPANCVLSYTDVKASFENTYSIMAVIMPFALAQLGSDAPIDQSLLPQTQTISKHLFGSATSFEATDNTLKMTSFGPVGGLRTASAAIIAGASIALSFQANAPSAAPWTTSAEPAPDAEDTSLKFLLIALRKYANDHSGLFPPDLAALDASGYLKPHYEVDVSKLRYVPSLTPDADSRLIVAFPLASSAGSRPALFLDGSVISLTNSEITEQVGGWLDLPPHPSPADLSAACDRNLIQLAASVKKFARFHDGSLPQTLDLSADYRFAPLVTTCPASPCDPRPHYALAPLASLAETPDPEAPSTLLVYETTPRHDGRHACIFLDTSIMYLSPDDLQAELEPQKDTQDLSGQTAPAAAD